MGPASTIVQGGGGRGGRAVVLAFQLAGIPNGVLDLAAVELQSTIPPEQPSAIVIQRDLDIPDGGSVTVDFTTGVAPVPRIATIGNLASGEDASFYSGFLSKHGTPLSLADPTPLSLTQFQWSGVPDASTIAGDVQTQTASATQGVPGFPFSSFPFRSVTQFNQHAADQTYMLPRPLRRYRR